MVGEQFAACKEACGDTVMKTIWSDDIVSVQVNQTETIDRVVSTPKEVPHRVYYGMSTKRAQKETGKSKLRTAEGIQKFVPINTDLATWTIEFTDNLRSLMSYANASTLEELKHIKHNIKYVRR